MLLCNHYINETNYFQKRYNFSIKRALRTFKRIIIASYKYIYCQPLYDTIQPSGAYRSTIFVFYHVRTARDIHTHTIRLGFIFYISSVIYIKTSSRGRATSWRGDGGYNILWVSGSRRVSAIEISPAPSASIGNDLYARFIYTYIIRCMACAVRRTKE